MEGHAMKINRRLIKRWIKALRSGDYNQCKQSLGKYNAATKEDAFCCLGVLCNVEGFEATQEKRALHNSRLHKLTFHNPKGNKPATNDWGHHYNEAYGVPKWSKSGLSESQQSHLINMNDTHGKTFDQIAVYLETKVLDA
jgi:hypothetical protein